jgi:hypothetical protein
MKFSAKRLFAAGIIGVAAVVTPMVLTVGLPVIEGGPAPVAFAGGSSSCPANGTNDVICYNQSTGSAGTFAQYVPASTNGTGTATTNSLTSAGGCAHPTWATTPLINFAGLVYDDGTYTSLSPLSAGANVDASKQKTGVCGVNGPGANPWSVDDTAAGAEQLNFSIGSNPNMGSNRLFSEAQLQIANGNSTQATVTLVETLTGTGQVGTQTCTIPAGSTVTVDTNGDAACPDSLTSKPPSEPPTQSFDTVEIQVPHLGDSVSVVGPSSQFLLANVICGGQTLGAAQNGGGIQATLSLTGPASQCKTYSSFQSSIQVENGQPTPVLSFNGFSAGTVQFTVQVTWPLEPECQAYSDPENAATNPTGIPADLTLPVCPVHHVSFDNVTYYDQTYCQSGNPVPPNGQPQAGLCTANKQYNNDSVSISKSGLETATPLFLPPSTNYSGPSVAVSNFTPQSPGTLAVDSSASFPPSGDVQVATTTGSAVLSYSGTTAGTLNNVVTLSGSGTLLTGNAVSPPATQIVETWVGDVDWYYW